jgi:UDP-N-acetylmuramoylalanine--D-glutamate ligase
VKGKWKNAGSANFSGRKILVVGLGISGLWTVRWLMKQGARVTVSDLRAESDLDPRWCRELHDSGVTLETGGHSVETFMGSEAIIISPGVPSDMKLLRDAARDGIPVFGELELAGRVVDTPIIGVTGTNGKSTVTDLLGQLLEAGNIPAFVGGNIGTPLMAYACDPRPADYAVIEVSSFQLDTAETFCPFLSVILNVSPDHLDRYQNYEAYVRSKLSIFRNQGPGHYVVLNGEDPILSSVEPPTGVAVLRYGSGRQGRSGAFLEGDYLVASLDGDRHFRFSTASYRLPGRHNLENLMAVVLAGLVVGLEPSVIQKAVGQFQALSHRLEPVAELGGILVYDDSKATNVDAAVRAIRSFDRPVIWIAGGRHKGADYAPLVDAARGCVRSAVFIGEAKERLAVSFEDVVPYALASSMEEAVSEAFAAARDGDVLLLAPACSSFDMYRDYAHRGEAFRQAVHRVIHG